MELKDKRLADIRAFKKRLSKIRVGLPSRVDFHYNRGIVYCHPKERMWIVKLDNSPDPIVHFIAKGERIDVTKYKSRLFLKLALMGELRDDSPINTK